jgi:hypothetical protein
MYVVNFAGIGLFGQGRGRMAGEWMYRVPLESLKSSRELLLAYEEAVQENALHEIVFVEVV